MTTSDSTTRATDDIRLVDGPDDALAARLDAELAEFNFDATGIRDAREFAAALHDEGGVLMAGVQGWTWGATCWVERLWVREDARQRGLRRRLLIAVESGARARGCGQLALTTHSFQAPGFYQRLGFETVGELADYPVGHASPAHAQAPALTRFPSCAPR
jgi:GNAT superfamily N-acetyltransferase